MGSEKILTNDMRMLRMIVKLIPCPECGKKQMMLPRSKPNSVKCKSCGYEEVKNNDR